MLAVPMVQDDALARQEERSNQDELQRPCDAPVQGWSVARNRVQKTIEIRREQILESRGPGQIWLLVVVAPHNGAGGFSKVVFA